MQESILGTMAVSGFAPSPINPDPKCRVISVASGQTSLMFDWLIKWSFRIEDFDINYKLRTAIKGRAISNFLVEFTYTEDTEEEVVLLELQSSIPT